MMFARVCRCVNTLASFVSTLCIPVDDVRLPCRLGSGFGDTSDLKLPRLTLLSAELRREPVCAGDSGGVPMSVFTCFSIVAMRFFTEVAFASGPLRVRPQVRRARSWSKVDIMRSRRSLRPGADSFVSVFICSRCSSSWTRWFWASSRPHRSFRVLLS
ncbi:hypothetical protein NP493_401g02040 [Ridgeia piscesae]|uniref:Secreted protein n=1 Tax=Ridgeia piscesae TaxID=27915 RepID=A0AAD9NUQ0_RIDPI|nr:hypothetical protein NP493_401g02040 [Ridgeia piscesae]